MQGILQDPEAAVRRAVPLAAGLIIRYQKTLFEGQKLPELFSRTFRRRRRLGEHTSAYRAVERTDMRDEI